jgi:hypothetical protein
MADSEENGHDSGPLLDLVTAKALSTFSQTTSRRGALALGGRLLLRALGVSMIPLLPLDRVFAQNTGGNPTDQNCADWQYCGIHGFFCTACCGLSTPAITACPPCTNTTKHWSTCCCCDSCAAGKGFTVSYIDCCGLNNPKPPAKPVWTLAQAEACQNKNSNSGAPGECKNATTWNWCGVGGGQYFCTIVSVGTIPCSYCNKLPCV